jgi:hypothetical protein
MVTATPLGLLRPVNGSTTPDPAAVVDCWGCADVDAVVGADVADGVADSVAEAVAVAPDAEAAEPGPDAPVLEHAALPAVATTIATVPAILLN